MTTYRARRRRTTPIVLGAVVVALGAGAVIGFVLRGSGGGDSPAKAALSLAHPSHTAQAAPTTTAAAGSLTVASVSPAAGATAVSATTPITVTFSSALSSSSTTPTLSPPVQGSWALSGDSATFTPTAGFTPLSEVTLSVPGGATGVHATNGATLASAVTEQFRIKNGSVLRLQQLLSLLAYSPLSWTPTGAAIAPNDDTAQVAALFDPPAGSFAWINRGWPKQLLSLFQPGRYNVFTKGLVMSFQADHGLDPNGHVGPGLWSALLSAVAANTVNTGGYNYALADKAAPEHLTIYHDGAVVLHSPANTGIAASPTPDGTFPVNTRLRTQVMHGTNPDGVKYADLVQYIAYFHGNDAVHYMDRADYGIPQSLGCVELPLTDAAHAWPYLAYGTLVSVIN